MEAADFTVSILKEIFRKHVLASRSSHLEVFCENYAADFFLKDYLRFKQIHLKCLLMWSSFFNNVTRSM